MKKGREMKEKKEKGYDPRIKAEIDRLTSHLNGLSEKSIGILKGPIEEACFMKVKLDDLKKEINEKGFTDEYRNSETQYGTKRSACVDTYATMVKNYTVLMKEIMSRLPEIDRETEDDGFMDFLNDKNCSHKAKTGSQ